MIQNLITMVGSSTPSARNDDGAAPWQNAFAGELERDDLDHHRDGLEHEQAANDRKHDLVLDGDGDGTERPPSDSEPVSPMKIIAGGALNQRKPRPAPMIAPHSTASSPEPRRNGS